MTFTFIYYGLTLTVKYASFYDLPSYAKWYNYTALLVTVFITIMIVLLMSYLIARIY